MALPEKVKKEDFETQVPEVARDHYNLAESEGMYYLGLVPKGQLDEFRTNNIKLKEKIEQLEADAKKFKDLDPEKYAKALKDLEEIKKKGGVDEKVIEDAVNKRTEAMKNDYEEKLATREKESSTLKGQLRNLTVNQKIREIAMSKEVGLRSEALTLVETLAKDVWSIDDNGNPIAKKSNGETMFGTDGQPLQLAAWISDLKGTHGYLFSEPTGSGAPPGGGGGGGGPTGKKRKDMSDDDKSAYIDKHGVDAFLKLPE